MDEIVQAEAAQWCRGANMGDKDKFAAADQTLMMGGTGTQTKTVAQCQEAFDTWMRLRARMDPKPKLDSVVATAVGCFAKAGDCGAAWRAYKAVNDAKEPGPERREPARGKRPERVTHGPSPDGWKGYTEEETRRGFDGVSESIGPSCKGK